MSKKKRKTNKKRIKFNKRKLLKFFLMFFLFFLVIIILLMIPTKNIFVTGNKILSDQMIIDKAELTDYPNLYQISLRRKADKLEKNDYIIEAVLRRHGFSEIHIAIKENYPLFLIDYQDKTVLLDGTKVADEFATPVLINYVPDLVYEDFLRQMQTVDQDVLFRISEIKYYPSEFDEERFLFYMVDGNYVFINLETMDEINDYTFIMEKIIRDFGDKNGVLHLDAGGYFEPFQ